MTQDEAQTIALWATSYLLEDDRARDGFLALTGVTPDELKENLADPGFLAGILDHVLGNEPMLLAFCGQRDLSPDRPAKARQVLSPDEYWGE